MSSAGPYDPNSMIGPKGYGPGIFVPGSAITPFPYQIDFENSPTATAPAQEVVITDPLDPNLDLSTFQLTDIGFGNTALSIPPGSQDYQTTVPMTENGVTFDVVINASLDYATRTLTVRFQSIDPQTQLPPDVLTGFLPPEDGTGRGQGYVGFMIAPKAGSAHGHADPEHRQHRLRRQPADPHRPGQRRESQPGDRPNQAGPDRDRQHHAHQHA